MKSIGITVVDHEMREEMQRDDLEVYLRNSLIERALNDDRLEDAFKTPVCDENGYADVSLTDKEIAYKNPRQNSAGDFECSV